MGKRRMFSKDIVRSDAFLDLPISSQALYFQLGMDTDDRGYISNAKSLIRMLGANQGDLEPLVGKGFVLVRGDSLLLQKHFRLNNYIQADRFKETTYLEDLKTLFIEENGAYTIDETKAAKKAYIKGNVACIQNVSNVDTQVNISEVNISKDNISEENSNINEEKEQIEIDKNRYKQSPMPLQVTLAYQLVECGYITDNELLLDKYDELVGSWLKYKDLIDIKVKISYFISQVTHLTPCGRDKEDRPIFKRRCDPQEIDSKIANKYFYFKESVERSFRQLDPNEDNIY